MPPIPECSQTAYSLFIHVDLQTFRCGVLNDKKELGNQLDKMFDFEYEKAFIIFVRVRLESERERGGERDRENGK